MQRRINGTVAKLHSVWQRNSVGRGAGERCHKCGCRWLVDGACVDINVMAKLVPYVCIFAIPLKRSRCVGHKCGRWWLVESACVVSHAMVKSSSSHMSAFSQSHSNDVDVLATNAAAGGWSMLHVLLSM